MKNGLRKSLSCYKAKKLNVVLVMLFIILTFLSTANFYNNSYAVDDESASYSETSSKSYSSTSTTKEYTTTKYSTTTTAKYDYYEDEDYDYQDEDIYENDVYESEYEDKYENEYTDDDDDYVTTTAYDYYEIDENIYHSSANSKNSSSGYNKNSSNANYGAQTNSNKTPNEINSQDWDQLLANLSSDTKSGKHFTFSDIDLYNSDSNNNGSWILWLGIMLIVIAILGISWVVYTELISKKSPRKMRAVAMARIAAKKANAANIAKSSSNKNIRPNNINNRSNEHGGSYTRRKPPEVHKIARQTVTPRRAEDRLNSMNNNYYNNQRNVKARSQSYTTYSQNVSKKNSSLYNQDRTFWDNFFGK